MTQADRAALEIDYFNLEPDWFIILTSILVVLVTICLGLRIYVRGFMIRAFGKDDFVLITTYVCHCFPIQLSESANDLSSSSWETPASTSPSASFKSPKA